MDWRGTTLAFYGLGAAALASSLLTLRRRLELSKAKHSSLTGHARLSRRIASLIPFYEFGEERFFCSDGAPGEIAARRRDGFMRLAALYRDRYAETVGRSAEAADGISDLRFVDAYRVPFQYRRLVQQHLRGGAAHRREVVAELLDAHLGPGVRDVVVVLGGAAEAGRGGRHGCGDEDPGQDRAPGMRGGRAAEPVQEAGHLSTPSCRRESRRR